MDLFDDLPAPEIKHKSPKKEENSLTEKPSEQEAPPGGLFQDLPSEQLVAPPSSMKRKLTDEDESNHKEHGGTVKKKASDLYDMRGYVAERKGEREDMQDTHVIIDDFLPHISSPHPSISRLSYYAVFDGHGGSRASQYAAQHIHKTLADGFPKGDVAKVENEIKKCFIDSFKKTDEAFLKMASKNKPSWKDGSTAVAVLVINNTAYIGNLGDSKAVLCRYSDGIDKYMPIPLTKDHSPSLYTERIRIQKAGGNVREGRVMGVLEVSRSFGDGPYKKHGVTCVPDVKRCQLTPQDKYILVACDGLWKKFDNDRAIAFVNQVVEEQSKEGVDVAGQWEAACNRAANEAVRRLSADNVTVALISIQAPS